MTNDQPTPFLAHCRAFNQERPIAFNPALPTFGFLAPTTNAWFDAAQVLARRGKSWEDFKSRFVDATGIPLKT
jgi:hypothetical protein